jgi:uncharacterized metal-binding protein/rhodanese-related sulfurtransferase
MILLKNMDRKDFSLDCTKCTNKGCRNGSPCIDASAGYISKYHSGENHDIVKAASSLVDGGRAGTLTRLEEITEYCRERGYGKIGVAYCYALEKEAASLQKYLSEKGFTPVMFSCTVDGLSESDIDPEKKENSVSCNPIGQADAINRSGAQFTVLVGLCLGHDILLQKNLKTDFTVFAVKDRVTGHRPLLGLPDIKAPEDEFLQNMPGGFHQMSLAELKKILGKKKSPEDFYLLDLGSGGGIAEDSLPGLLHCSLASLPQKYAALLPDKSKEIIVSSGGAASLYAVMFLSLKGYARVQSVRDGPPD